MKEQQREHGKGKERYSHGEGERKAKEIPGNKHGTLLDDRQMEQKTVPLFSCCSSCTTDPHSSVNKQDLHKSLFHKVYTQQCRSQKRH